MTDEQKRIEARIKWLEAARVQLIEALEALVDEAAIQAEAALAAAKACGQEYWSLK